MTSENTTEMVIPKKQPFLFPSFSPETKAIAESVALLAEQFYISLIQNHGFAYQEKSRTPGYLGSVTRDGVEVDCIPWIEYAMINISIPVDAREDPLFSHRTCGGYRYLASREELILTASNLESMIGRTAQLYETGRGVFHFNKDKAIPLNPLSL